MSYELERIGDAHHFGDLYQLAERHSGYLTSREADRAGIARSTLSYHARTGGRLIHVARGLYRLRHYPSTPHEHIVAGWLRAAPSADAVVSHHSACELLDLCDLIADEVHVTVPRERRRKPIDGLVIHPTTFPVPQEQRQRVLGVPVTSAERTIIDLLRFIGLTEQVEASTTQALRLGLTTEHRLLATAAGFPDTVTRQIRALLP